MNRILRVIFVLALGVIASIWIQSNSKANHLINSIGLKFQLVKAGTFQAVYYEHHEPLKFQETIISRDFYLMTTEITNSQWNVLGQELDSEVKFCKQCPATAMNWDMIQDYLKKLNQREGCHLSRTQIWDVYLGKSKENASGCYRLPTRAEWMYTCQAGTNHYLSDLQTEEKQLNSIWYKRTSLGVPREVGSLSPNPWGYYDMLGNISEWIVDDSALNYQEIHTQSVTDPVYFQESAENRQNRIVVGGDINSLITEHIRCDKVYSEGPAALSWIQSHIGLRLVRNP